MKEFSITGPFSKQAFDLGVLEQVLHQRTFPTSQLSRYPIDIAIVLIKLQLVSVIQP